MSYLGEKKIRDSFTISADQKDNGHIFIQVFLDHWLCLPNANSNHKSDTSSLGALFYCHKVMLEMITLPLITGGVDQLTIADRSTPSMKIQIRAI